MKQLTNNDDFALALTFTLSYTVFIAGMIIELIKYYFKNKKNEQTN